MVSDRRELLVPVRVVLAQNGRTGGMVEGQAAHARAIRLPAAGSAAGPSPGLACSRATLGFITRRQRRGISASVAMAGSGAGSIGAAAGRVRAEKRVAGRA